MRDLAFAFWAVAFVVGLAFLGWIARRVPLIGFLGGSASCIGALYLAGVVLTTPWESYGWLIAIGLGIVAIVAAGTGFMMFGQAMRGMRDARMPEPPIRAEPDPRPLPRIIPATARRLERYQDESRTLHVDAQGREAPPPAKPAPPATKPARQIEWIDEEPPAGGSKKP